MLTTPFKNAILILLLASSLTALDATADKVVLKDGTVEESIRVWESDKYVHFILKGTRSVEIRYAKEIVDHLESGNGIVSAVKIKATDATPQPQPPPSVPTPSSRTVKETSPVTRPTPASESASTLDTRPMLIQPDRSFVERNRNQAFYDPRRPKRYWADRQSQHATYEAAVAVLAAQYNRSADWIGQHMGQENDLGLIHASLIAAAEAEATSASNAPVVAPGEGPDMEPSKASEVAVVPVAHQDTAMPQVRPRSPEGVDPVPSGISFYDPRRPEKYWATPKDHCASLQEAVQVLAKIYGVPPSQIEANLGDSNDLSQVHSNIQRSLGSLPK